MSLGRISVQRSSTSLDLEKKRWPPMSKEKPLYLTVREIPPTYVGSASSTVTGTCFLASKKAAVKPAGPAPMMPTEVAVTDGFSHGSTGEKVRLWAGWFPA